MALKDRRIPVPLGQGIDRETEEFKLTPPYLRNALNVKYTKRGAVAKRSGWSLMSGGSLGLSANSNIMVKSKDTLAVFSDNRNKLYKGGVTSSMGVAPVPCEIKSHPVFPVNGIVLSTEVAHAGGYTAVVAQVHRDVTAMTNNNYESAEAWCAIMDSNWNVIWGPYKSDKIGICPRVEAMQVSSAPAFMFLGLEDQTASGSAYWLGATQLVLNAVYITAAGLSPTAYNGLANVTPYQNTTSGGYYILYDTWSDYDNNGRVYISYYDATPSLIMGDIQNTGTHTATVIAGPGATPNSMATYYDSASDTVMVYSEETGTLYYNNQARSGAGTVAHPGTPPVSDNTADARWPVFWIDGNSDISLTDRVISITGSGPGTPSFGSQFSIGKLHARPQRRGTSNDSFYFSEYVFTSTTEIFGYYGKGIEVIGTDASGNDIPVTIAPMHGSRHTDRYKINFYWRGQTNGKLGVIKQTARTSAGALLKADHIVTSGFLPRNRANGWAATNTRDLSTGIGALGDVNTVVVNEVDFIDPQYSYITHYDSAIIASGALYTFDGEQTCPLFSRQPESVTVVTATNWPNDPTNPIAFSIAANSEYQWAVTITYVDKNNVRHRFKGSNTATRQNATGSPVNAGDGITFQGFPSEIEHLAEAGLLTAEFWAAEDYATGGTANTSLILTNRSPIVWDGTQWIADFGSIIEPAQVDNPTPYPYLTEALPAQVPASNIVAKAGDYVFAVASEQPTELWVSKPLGNYTAPEFAAELMISAPAEAGEIRSLAALDDHLILLCENGLWELFVGSGGPTSLGTGGFPEFGLLHRGSGAITHRGTVWGDWGVMYMASDGPKLFRQGQLIDIGAKIIDQITPTNIDTVVYDEEAREVWVFFEGSNSYTFDVDLLAWAAQSIQTLAADYFGGEVTRLTDQGVLAQPSSTATTDSDGVYYLAQIQSPWLSVADPMMYKRFRRVGALLNRDNAGALGQIIIKIAYDYVDTDIDTMTFNASSFDAFEKLMQFVVRCTRQKTDAIRITIIEGTEASGQSQVNTLLWTLTNLELRVAAKTGLIKLQEGAKQ